MSKLLTLTDEQWADEARCYDEWLAHGLSTEPLDFPHVVRDDHSDVHWCGRVSVAWEARTGRHCATGCRLTNGPPSRTTARSVMVSMTTPKRYRSTIEWME